MSSVTTIVNKRVVRFLHNLELVKKLEDASCHILMNITSINTYTIFFIYKIERLLRVTVTV